MNEPDVSPLEQGSNWQHQLRLSSLYPWHIIRDQLNSQFHGRDIFREIDLLPWKTLISMKSVIFREF